MAHEFSSLRTIALQQWHESWQQRLGIKKLKEFVRYRKSVRELLSGVAGACAILTSLLSLSSRG